MGCNDAAAWAPDEAEIPPETDSDSHCQQKSNGKTLLLSAQRESVQFEHCDHSTFGTKQVWPSSQSTCIIGQKYRKVQRIWKVDHTSAYRVREWSQQSKMRQRWIWIALLSLPTLAYPAACSASTLLSSSSTICCSRTCWMNPVLMEARVQARVCQDGSRLHSTLCQHQCDFSHRNNSPADQFPFSICYSSQKANFHVSALHQAPNAEA